MVGIVIVSHSQKLAESVVELSALMAPETPMAAAGGMEDGGFGTSFEKIYEAIDSVYSDDGVIVLMDLGSAVMTTEMVIESMEGQLIKMVDCPIWFFQLENDRRLPAESLCYPQIFQPFRRFLQP